MNEYEYRISASNPREVQVRLKYAGRGRYPAWGLYMLADSEEQAQRVLALLQQPETTSESVVRE